jgi:hypothetical protein
MKVTSRALDADSAWSIACEGGDISESRPAPHPPGTSVEVRDLFYNTPARRKFLRTERTEFTHLDSVVKNLALARFDVEFTLKHNQRSLLRLPVAADRVQREARIAELCGGEFLEHARYFEKQIEGMRLEGWLAAPTFSRAQGDLQFTFVNGRFVRDKLLRHASRLAYRDVLFQARHPAYVLFLTLDPKRVDANAHPAKLEIRFRDSRLIHDFVFRTKRCSQVRLIGWTCLTDDRRRLSALRPIASRGPVWAPGGSTRSVSMRPRPGMITSRCMRVFIRRRRLSSPVCRSARYRPSDSRSASYRASTYSRRARTG